MNLKKKTVAQNHIGKWCSSSFYIKKIATIACPKLFPIYQLF